MKRGFLYVAYGHRARREVLHSIEALRTFNQEPLMIISDTPVADHPHIYCEDRDPGARLAKLNMDKLTPFKYTFYLDADTRPQAPLRSLFDILEDGWEMVIAVNRSQNEKWLWNIGEQDRRYTIEAVGDEALSLQGGVLGFRQCNAVRHFFEAWRAEWKVFEDKDQGALLRALYKTPLKVWLLGTPWNGGALIVHKSGKARRHASSYRQL